VALAIGLAKICSLLAAAKDRNQMTARVERVLDGDTFVLEGVAPKIRIWGLDAPERDMIGGAAATKALSSLINGVLLRCDVREIDRYRRTVGQCFLPDGRDVAVVMISSGTAKEYCRYSTGSYSTCWHQNAKAVRWKEPWHTRALPLETGCNPKPDDGLSSPRQQSGHAKRLDQMTSSPFSPRPPSVKANGANEAKRSVLASDLTIEGDVLGGGPLLVQAVVTGNIRGAEVFIDTTASITGDVDAGTLAVAGKLRGKVLADRIEIRASGHVIGHLTYQSLTVQEGGIFEGELRKVAPPAAHVAQPSGSATE